MQEGITTDRSQIAYCGSYCGDCTWKEKTGCKGCQASQGNMFYGECSVDTLLPRTSRSEDSL